MASESGGSQIAGFHGVRYHFRDVERSVAFYTQQLGFTLWHKLESGPGGRQIQIEDPDGNPIELFEPGRR